MAKKNPTQVWLSQMSGKLKGLFGVNTNPLTNPFCQRMHQCHETSCEHCYAIVNLETRRKNCIPCFQHNSELLSGSVLTPDQFPTFTGKFKYCRLHCYGELINETHLRNFINIARAHPELTFGLFSKQVALVRKFTNEFPSNMIRVFSTSRLDFAKPRVPAGFDKVFSVYTAEYAQAKGVVINCTGKSCAACLQCYHKGGDSIINEILKEDQHAWHKAHGGAL